MQERERKSVLRSRQVGLARSIRKTFFSAAPAFELLFAGDGVAHIRKRLEVDELDSVVLCAEAGEVLLPVLQDAEFEMAGDAGVEDARGASHDIDVVNHGEDG
jgi:hypothetical protein